LFKTKLINLYNKYTVSTYFYDKLHGNVGISADEMDVLNSLREDKSIMICKADKGNAVVLLNKVDYLNKINTILSDKSRFKEIEHDNNTKNLEKF